jgi:hypothetical protein
MTRARVLAGLGALAVLMAPGGRPAMAADSRVPAAAPLAAPAAGRVVLPAAPGPAAVASVPSSPKTDADLWSRLLAGSWEYRAVDRAGRQVEITTLRFLPGGEYLVQLQYGPFPSEPVSRGRLRITNATATHADLLLTPSDQDPERLADESALTTRVQRLDANRLRAADGSELLRKP